MMDQAFDPHTSSFFGEASTEGPARGIEDTQPAARWEDALLSGNGRYGIMVYGDPLHEVVIYNDHTFVYPDEDTQQPPDIAAVMLQVRQALLAGNYLAAEEIAFEAASKTGWSYCFTQPFHPGYKMEIVVPFAGTPTSSMRKTNFSTGEITVIWSDTRGDWVRTSFVSRADQVIVQRLTAPTNGKLTASFHLSGELADVPTDMAFITQITTDAADQLFLTLKGIYPASRRARGYEGVTRVAVIGGTASIDQASRTLTIAGADEVLLLTVLNRYLSADTWDTLALQLQLSVLPADYALLLARHVSLHRPMYERVMLDLHASPHDRALSTTDLLAKQRQHPSSLNPALLEKLFDSGRYLFLSASGYYPPRLTGLWLGAWNAAWAGDFTTDANLNLQVAGGNIGDLPEAMDAYFRLILGQIQDWQLNARHIMGTRGILAPPRTDGENGYLFHFQMGYPGHFWTGGADWLLFPFLEYYQVTGDTHFLRERLLPWLVQLAIFYEDFLHQTDGDGKVIFLPSYSQENAPANTGVMAAINATQEIAAAKHGLQTVIAVCNQFNLEQGTGEGVERWQTLLSRLPAYRINQDEALAEWAWPDLADHYDHRHISHLYPVWPLHEITPDEEPILAAAAQRALELRGEENGSAHGILHTALAQARLKDGEQVAEQIRKLLTRNYLFRSFMTSHNPDLEIYNADAAITLPAIVMEMLIDSRPGVLELLPALPPELVQGSIRGVKGRNRVTIVHLDWDRERKLIHAVVRSEQEQDLTLIYRRGIHALQSNVPSTTSPLGVGARVISLQAGVNATIAIQSI